MDESLLTALLVVMGVNVFLWLGQFAALELNPEGPQFYNCQDSLLGSVEASGCTGTTYVLDDTNPAGSLPSGGGEIEVESGNVFTDTFSAATNWLTESTGLRYLYNILAAPSNFLKAIGVPDAFAFAVGAMWYVVTFLLLVAFVLGR
jgi:hypothetical protein